MSAAEPWSLHRKYCVVVDAGSSGSRIQVYSWKDPAHLRASPPANGLARLPIIERGADPDGLHWQFKEEPGISTFAGHKGLEVVGGHLQPLVDFALSVVPAALVSETPFYLLATAGVRLLPDTTRTALLQQTCQYMQAHSPFLIPDCARHIRVLTGEEEGVFGWIAINYLMGGFNRPSVILGNEFDDDDAIDPSLIHSSHPPARLGVQRPHYHRTFGFLDMGGASTQIAYEPTATVARAHAHDITRVRLPLLDGHLAGYKIYVTTFLGFGTNEAKRRYLDAKSAEAPSSDGVIGDHCLNPGLLIPLHTATNDQSPSNQFLRGHGDFDACRTSVLPLLNKTAICHEPPCLFNGVHTPGVDFSRHRFVGVSEYWYSSHDVFGLGGPYYAEEYEVKARDFCRKDWSSIIAEHVDHGGAGGYHTQLELDRLRSACFKAAWMTTILHDGFGVPRDPVEHWGEVDGVVQPASSRGPVRLDTPMHEQSHIPAFQSIDRVDDVAVSWTLGAVLMEGVAGTVPPPDTASWAGWLTGGAVSDQTVVAAAASWGVLLLCVGAVLAALARRREIVVAVKKHVASTVAGSSKDECYIV